MPLAGAGRVIFAAIMVGIGIAALVDGRFGAIWEPIPKDTPARDALAALSALVSLGCGLGMLLDRTVAFAARMLLAWLLLWVLAFRLPVIVHAPLVEVSWEGCGETIVYVAGVWCLYARFATTWDRQILGFATGPGGLRIARVLLGLALIAFGLSHFVYAKDTASLVPAWLPAQLAWAYFTGSAYLLAGFALIVDVRARLAATLAAVQMGLFTLLVWVPVIAAAGPKSAFQWSETIVSATLTAGAWIVADSLRATAGSAARR